MEISIVVPLYNEEDSIRLLYNAISDAVSSDFKEYEIIFVDDGSCDRTFEFAEQLVKSEEPQEIN